MHWFIFVVTIITTIVISSSAHGSTYIDAGDEIYSLLSRLEAEGVITDSLLSTKPLSRREVVRLVLAAEANAAGRSEFVKELVRSLKGRVRSDEYTAGDIKPVESLYAGYISTNADVRVRKYPGAVREQEQAFNYNNDGDLYDRGSNYRIGLTSRLEDLGPLSLYLNPEYRINDDNEKGALKKGYGVLSFSWIDVFVGKDSQWWGPGHHGAILLSNNAEPLTMVKLAGPGPQVLPGPLRHLGPFQFDLFVSRLDKDRNDFSRPYLWGLRFDFKPHPWVEIGLERTSILGGGGRPADAKTWMNSLTSNNEHNGLENPGDQKAGGDIKITLPFTWQPAQIYWERVGEENRMRKFRPPYKFADIYGVYLPSFLGSDRIELRAEYARNNVKKQPYVWYAHGTYTSGYTYRGTIMGHHMGTESSDLFLDISCVLPENDARISLSFDREKHTLAGPVSEKVTEVSIKCVSRISKRLEVSALIGYGWIENPGNTAGPIKKEDEISTFMRYAF